MANEALRQKMLDSAFENAGLPEVKESELEIGTYTNAQISEKMKGREIELVTLLVKVSLMGDSKAAKRNILSMAVEITLEKK